MPRVYVVDDHDEALEAIHEAIREREAPMQNLAMVHFDAHPDLSVPRGLPASAVYAPGALYEHLSDGDGGISEWILPLVMAEHVSTVWWVRPEWTHDIPDGCHSVTIGALEPTPEELLAEEDSTQSHAHDPEEYRGPPHLEAVLANRRLRVATELQYWCDDHWCIADPARMNPKAEFTVLVSTAASPATTNSAPAAIASVSAPPAAQIGSAEALASSCNSDFIPSNSPHNPEDWNERITSHAAKVQACDGWVLDICLDYFGTHNPFAFQLASRGGHRLAAALQAAAAGARKRGAIESMSKNAGERGVAEASANAPVDKREAARWLEEGLTNVLRELNQPTKAHASSPRGSTPEDDEGGEVQNDTFYKRLLCLYASRDEGETLVETLAAEATAASKAPQGGVLLDLALAMVPCACLPDVPGTGAETHIYLQNLRTFLRMPAMQQLGLPCAVTLARSSGDPFTPPERLRWLEAQVKELVLELYGYGDTPYVPTLPSGYYGAPPVAIARKSVAAANMNENAGNSTETSQAAAQKKQRQSETTLTSVKNVDEMFTNWLEEYDDINNRRLKRKHVPLPVELGLPVPDHFARTVGGSDGNSSSEGDGVGDSICIGAGDGRGPASTNVDGIFHSCNAPALLSMCRAGALLKAKAWSMLHPNKPDSSTSTSSLQTPKDAHTWWVCPASVEANAMSAVQNQSTTSSSRSSSLASQERQPMQGDEMNGCVVYANMSQLLADAVEWWAHSGVVHSEISDSRNTESSEDTTSGTVECSHDASTGSSGLSVHSGCTRWVFPDGTLFGAQAKWWADSSRRSPHEGLDFVSYFDLSGTARDVQPCTPVAPLLPGTVVAIFPDFMQTTVVVATTPSTVRVESKLSSGDRSQDGDDDLSEKHFLAPNLCVETWPVGRKLLMIYAHIVVADGLAVGSVLSSPTDRVGTVAPVKLKPAPAASSATTGASSNSNNNNNNNNTSVNRLEARVQPPRRAAAAPPHLHLSLAWAPLEAPPPQGWDDLVSPSMEARVELTEPPIPAGFFE